MIVGTNQEEPFSITTTCHIPLQGVQSEKRDGHVGNSRLTEVLFMMK